jgi:hypothetical protein
MPPRIRTDFPIESRSSPHMEKEFIDRAKAIREGILQLRDSL